MGVFTTEGGVLCECGVYNGSNSSLFGYSFCGPAYFITRSDKLLRVRMIYYACGRSITHVDNFFYACGYLYDLMLCKKIVLMLLKVN